MPSRITLAELTERLPDILERVRDRGESVVVERDGEPLVTIVPPAAGRAKTWRELVERLAALSRPDDRFADDLELAQVIMNRTPAEPPAWPS